MSIKAATFIIAIGLSCAVASAQNNWWIPRGPRVEDAVLIEEPALIRLLFQRAEDGIARRDWKFAIDSLQRILEHPDGSLVASTDRLRGAVTRYESASSRALRRLLALPPEGLEAYRILYDGRARRLIERAESRRARRFSNRSATHVCEKRSLRSAPPRTPCWVIRRVWTPGSNANRRHGLCLSGSTKSVTSHPRTPMHSAQGVRRSTGRSWADRRARMGGCRASRPRC